MPDVDIGPLSVEEFQGNAMRPISSWIAFHYQHASVELDFSSGSLVESSAGCFSAFVVS